MKRFFGWAIPCVLAVAIVGFVALSYYRMGFKDGDAAARKDICDMLDRCMPASWKDIKPKEDGQ